MRRPPLLSRNPARTLWVNGAIGVTGLILLEAVFGSWLFPPRLGRLDLIRDSTLYYDAGHLYDTKGERIVYRRDQYGLRGPYKNLSSIDVLTLGGASTDQRYIAEGKTWQDVLRQDFLAAGKKVSVVNAGVDGQSTFGHIKNFESWFPQIPGLRARWFLFYIGVKDFNREAGYKFDNLAAPEPRSFRQFLRNRSALYSLYRVLRGLVLTETYHADSRRVDFQTVDWTEAPTISGDAFLSENYFQAYEKRLRILIEKVRQWNATPIFVTQASRRYKKAGGKIEGTTELIPYEGRQVNGVDYYRIMRKIHEKTLEACRESGGICIDLDGELELEDSDFYDFTNITPQGSEKIGHYLFKKLRPFL